MVEVADTDPLDRIVQSGDGIARLEDVALQHAESGFVRGLRNSLELVVKGLLQLRVWEAIGELRVPVELLDERVLPSRGHR